MVAREGKRLGRKNGRKYKKQTGKEKKNLNIHGKTETYFQETENQDRADSGTTLWKSCEMAVEDCG